MAITADYKPRRLVGQCLYRFESPHVLRETSKRKHTVVSVIKFGDFWRKYEVNNCQLLKFQRIEIIVFMIKCHT